MEIAISRTTLAVGRREASGRIRAPPAEGAGVSGLWLWEGVVGQEEGAELGLVSLKWGLHPWPMQGLDVIPWKRGTTVPLGSKNIGVDGN